MSAQKHDIDTCKILTIGTHNAEQFQRTTRKAIGGKDGEQVEHIKKLHGYATGAREMLAGVKGDRIRLGMTSTGHGHADPILKIEGEVDIAACEVYISRLMRVVVEAKKNQIEHGSGPLGIIGGPRPADLIGEE